ncbi:MAG: alpha/beta hydrolase [Nitrososphaerales archaeon]
MRRGFVDTAEGQIHYREDGVGKPVLLLHQTPRSSDEYLDVLPIIGQRYHAIAMDTIGFGDSYKPKKSCSIEDYAQGVITFLNHIGIEKASLVGHHTGGVIALEVAASYPERVEKLVLSAIPYIDEEERRRRKGKKVIDYYEIKEDGSHLIELWRGRQPFYPPNRPDLLMRFIVDAIKAGEKAFEGHIAVSNYRMEDKAPLVKCPTLVICGTEDPFSYPHMQRVANAIKNSEMLPIVGGTVALVDQMPEYFAKVVLAFLDEGL